MTYDEAFQKAVHLNAATCVAVHIYRIKMERGVEYWATQDMVSPHSSLTLIGEVRRFCKR